MDYRKKIKRNIGLFTGYAVVGIALILLYVFKIIENDFFMSFGSVITLVAIVRIIQNVSILNNNEKLKKYEIAAKDERNLMLNDKAKNLAFSIYIFAAAAAIIIFAALKMQIVMLTIAYSVCALTFIYWICYHVIKNKY